MATRVTTPQQRAAAVALRSVLAAKVAAQDLLDVGAYKPGTNPKVDAAVAHADAIDAFLQQGIGEPADPGESWARLNGLVGMLGGA